MAEDASPTDAVDTGVQDTDDAQDMDVEDKLLTDDWKSDETTDNQVKQEESTEKPGQAETENPTEEAEKQENPETPNENTDEKEQARQGFQMRQVRKQERQKEIEEQHSDWAAEPEDPIEQRLRAVELREYSNQIAETETSLVRDYERAAADIPMFNPGAKDTFNQAAYDRAINDFNAGYVQYDTNGNMVGTKASLYDYLQNQAAVYEQVGQTYATRGQQAAAKQQAIAETPPASSGRVIDEDDEFMGLGDLRLT